MKKLIALMLSILMVCSLAACASKQDSASASTETASTEASGEEKTLTMATNVAFPPYEFYENARTTPPPDTQSPSGVVRFHTDGLSRRHFQKQDCLPAAWRARLRAI